MEKNNWSKKGQIFDPYSLPEWGRTHGQLPYYFNIDGVEKVYFTSRPPVQADGNYVSHIYVADIVRDIDNKMQVKLINKEPLLSFGTLGTFDEFGTMPASVIKHPTKNEVWMYYAAWTRLKSVPYTGAIGLAISKDGGNTFHKMSTGPLISTSIYDPILLGCPRVHIFNNKWYLFYLSGIEWCDSNGKKEIVYKLKLATSDDGLNWVRNYDFVIPENYNQECQTAATIFEKDGKYHMYFTYRHSLDFRNPERGYRIGYAVSSDLKKWERNDEIGNFSTSASGWDSEMVCYPHISKINDKYIMLYCGNSFGRHGFGYAELI